MSRSLTRERPRGCSRLLRVRNKQRTLRSRAVHLLVHACVDIFTSVLRRGSIAGRGEACWRPHTTGPRRRLSPEDGREGEIGIRESGRRGRAVKGSSIVFTSAHLKPKKVSTRKLKPEPGLDPDPRTLYQNQCNNLLRTFPGLP